MRCLVAAIGLVARSHLVRGRPGVAEISSLQAEIAARGLEGRSRSRGRRGPAARRGLAHRGRGETVRRDRR